MSSWLFRKRKWTSLISRWRATPSFCTYFLLLYLMLVWLYYSYNKNNAMSSRLLHAQSCFFQELGFNPTLFRYRNPLQCSCNRYKNMTMEIQINKFRILALFSVRVHRILPCFHDFRNSTVFFAHFCCGSCSCYCCFWGLLQYITVY